MATCNSYETALDTEPWDWYTTYEVLEESESELKETSEWEGIWYTPSTLEGEPMRFYCEGRDTPTQAHHIKRGALYEWRNNAWWPIPFEENYWCTEEE